MFGAPRECNLGRSALRLQMAENRNETHRLLGGSRYWSGATWNRTRDLIVISDAL
jgi:hypothetical protein